MPDQQIDWRKLHAPFRVPLFVWIGAVVAVWMLSAGLIVYWFKDWSERGQFGDTFGAVNSLFSGLAFAGVVLALLLQNHALRQQLEEVAKAHDWNRRKSAHDLIFEASLGRFGELRRQFEIGIDIYDPNQTSATQALSPEKKLQLDTALNFLENVCLSIKNNVVDEEIVYAALSDILVAYWRWSQPYVRECRRASDDFWTEIEPYDRLWRQKAETAREAARKPRDQPGKARL